MATFGPESIGLTYRFLNYAPAILGSGYEAATVMSILDFETASNFGIDLIGLHRQILPMLPVGTIDDPTAYTYVRIKLADTGKSTILGIPWIREESIQRIDSQTVSVKVLNCAAQDTIRIRDALVRAGFDQLVISTVTNPQ